MDSQRMVLISVLSIGLASAAVAAAPAAENPADGFPEQTRVRQALPPPPGLITYRGVTTPIDPLLQAAAALGNVECGPDPDGIYRRVPLISTCRGRILPILGFAAYCRFQSPGKWRFEAGELVQGSYRVPVDQAGRLLLKFSGSSRSFKRFSAANVIQSEVRLQHGKDPFYQPGGGISRGKCGRRAPRPDRPGSGLRLGRA